MQLFASDAKPNAPESQERPTQSNPHPLSRFIYTLLQPADPPAFQLEHTVVRYQS